jgi:putative ABC transport system ATP-binding protein
LILADEPTGNLDQETGRAVMELLFHQVAENGGTLLLVTHDPSLTARFNRVIQLADGRIVTPVQA